MSFNDQDVVHADLSDGSRITRQDRAGKYRLEFAPSAGKKSKAIGLSDAVELIVADSGKPGSKVHYGRYGGTVFDARVRRALAAARTQRVD